MMVGCDLQLGAKPFLFPLLDRFGFGHTTEMGNRRGSDSWFLCCSLRQCVSSFVSFDVLMTVAFEEAWWTEVGQVA